MKDQGLTNLFISTPSILADAGPQRRLTQLPPQDLWHHPSLRRHILQPPGHSRHVCFMKHHATDQSAQEKAEAGDDSCCLLHWHQEYGGAAQHLDADQVEHHVT